MTEGASAIRIHVHTEQAVPILLVAGILDSSTYRSVRDAVIKAALDEPRAVIVDVDRLSAPAASAWIVFTSARWHVSIWPDVPIMLVCSEPHARRAIAANGVAGYVAVHATRELALHAVAGSSLHVRRRARTELPRSTGSPGFARAVVTDWLKEWDRPDLISAAATVATVFVENVLEHTESSPVVLVESYRDGVTVAVEDCNARLPSRHEDERGAEIVSGLAIVSALCRVWGSTPTPSGKTVWALLGREDHM
ncbi:sulfate transporter [Mycobacterium seoulense]|uniref:Sulfate transporter n=1 Tax=Mycobacterium seoulense TaxID=386911 RepID=A0A7I7NSS7_9MYCO|nr:sulfate transporter [Mycobacterium seoulense]MCV7439725.1 sulfate transporter [Mycobacterium seoulense]BBX99652.1 sulfate transporter [Mycobacterium seoulense]